MASKLYTIDRSEAGKILQMSTRTVDRYIAKKILSVQRRQGRLYLNKEEIDGLHFQGKVDSFEVDLKRKQKKEERNDGVEIVDFEKNKIEKTGNENLYNLHQSEVEIENRIYRELFEKAEKKIEEQQGQLLISWQKIAELQSDLKNSVPLLSMQNDKKTEEIEKKNLEISLQKALFMKRVYFVVFVVCIALLPILVFLF